VRRPRASLLALAVSLAGCATTLPYLPERQPGGLTISADVSMRDDRLLVKIESEGYRVERAVLVRDGVELLPESLVAPADARPSGLSVGIGVGGGASRGSYGVGTGVGVGGGGYRVAATLAAFRLDQAGPPPWRLRLKVVGVEPVDIVLDPSRSARGRTSSTPREEAAWTPSA
jgi:hypothetical protein